VSLHEITRLPDPPPSSGVPLPGHAESGSTPATLFWHGFPHGSLVRAGSAV
jgi:hypothetical protein